MPKSNKYKPFHNQPDHAPKQASLEVVALFEAANAKPFDFINFQKKLASYVTNKPSNSVYIYEAIKNTMFSQDLNSFSQLVETYSESLQLRDLQGNTFLHVYALSARLGVKIEFLSLLMPHIKGLVDDKNQYGETALDTAKRMFHPQLQKIKSLLYSDDAVQSEYLGVPVGDWEEVDYTCF